MFPSPQPHILYWSLIGSWQIYLDVSILLLLQKNVDLNYWVPHDQNYNKSVALGCEGRNFIKVVVA